MEPVAEVLRYRRSRFSTRLPLDYRYTAAHFWLCHEGNGLWRIGLTKFATRMLGDLVESGMEISPGDAVTVGQIIGWVECLKAASDLFCMAEGHFHGANGDLAQNPEWLQKDPYGKGWLYQVRGEPEPAAMDAQGYAEHLDQTIDQMLGESS